ncbi:MAG: bifunctional aspartate kinase/diaminopimelate decarboxylase [Bradymonadaceae bacterium]|nr:bifunctional aspartate kinase/diaminopimelate decarboxylase [Lujinxingiaceae bacterium]
MNSQDWIVVKFGGTSVSSRERWDTIARVARQSIAQGLRPLIVCSALSGVSNMLEKLLVESKRGEYDALLNEVERRHRVLADEMGVDFEQLLGEEFEELGRLLLGVSLIREVSPRVHARVMAMGELMSTRLGAAYLTRTGLETSWCDARQMLLSMREPNATEHRLFLSAACDFSPDGALTERLGEMPGAALLTQGFIARDDAGETVLLGRGGSDTSAAYFAAKIGATRLEIWTDVPGMFTANPREVPSARLLRQLDYDEAQELATMGAKVLHPRCLPPVRANRIPLHIKCTEHPELEGTVISSDAPDFGAQVKAISAKTGISLVSMNTLGMWQQVGFLADIFGVFKQNGLSIDLVGTSEANVTVTLDPMANALDPGAVNHLLADLKAHCDARIIGPCAAVSLVGHNIRSILHRLAPALEVFEEHKIYMVSQAASDLNLTFVVDEDQADRLVRKLHSLLFRERTTDEMFGPTWQELFGAEEEAPVFATAWWRARRDELLSLAAVESPVYVYDAPSLQSSVDSLLSIEPVNQVFYAVKANPHPEILKQFYAAGLGFECVSPGELEHVRGLFPKLGAGRLLFTPNFAPEQEYRLGFEYGAYVTLDNMHPVERWPEVFAGKEVLVRIDPGQGYGHHKYVRTAGPQSKFGVSPGELARLKVLAEQVGFKIVGLHAHVGSGVRTTGTWSQTALFLAEAAQDFPDVRILNLGGGLGVPERANQNALDIAELSQTLASFKEAHPRFELWLEPGRYLVAQAGVLLATVTQLKQKGAIRYVGIDAGMNSLIRPALYGAYHEIVNLTRLDEPTALEAEIVGPICESGDVLGHLRRLPTTEQGDVLLIATAGAYGRSMSSFYNLRAPATEHFLKG